MSVILMMAELSKRFGPTVALDDVSLAVKSGQALALVGENGAGKSTLMKILSGAIRADSGAMQIAGRPYAPRGPVDARKAGVSMIYQELNIAPDLSVADNILLGQEPHRLGWSRRRLTLKLAREAMGRLGHCEIDFALPAGQVSIAEQQLIEIARSLLSDARVIILDEPTSSLTQSDTRRLFDVIGRLKKEGVAVIYISHFLEEIREIGDEVAVLRDGKLVDQCRLEEIDDAEIVHKMVGREVGELFPSVPRRAGEVVLEVAGLHGSHSPVDITFELRRGEVLGIAGLVGAGRTELLRALFGLDEVRSGSIKVAGNVAIDVTPRKQMTRGIGFVSEDRKNEGLMLDQSLGDNLTLGHLGPFSQVGWLRLGLRQRRVEELCDTIQVKRHSSNQPVGDLSGGNQQKVAIARVLHQDADILLLDEPTRGIDVGTKSEIYRLIGRLAASGKSVLFVSSYLPELLNVCDRIAVMSRGRLREIRAASAWNQAEIMKRAIES